PRSPTRSAKRCGTHAWTRCARPRASPVPSACLPRRARATPGSPASIEPHPPGDTRMTTRKPPRLALLALALAAGIAGPAFAQADAAKAPTAADREQLDAARARLDAAARQYAELASRLATDQQAMEYRLLRKPVIGVVLASAPEAGVRIAAVTPGGAAAEAGLKSGDLIVAVD